MQSNQQLLQLVRHTTKGTYVFYVLMERRLIEMFFLANYFSAESPSKQNYINSHYITLTNVTN